MSAPREAALLRAELPLPLVARGKVRDVFAVDEQHLLFVASDRISAYDVVMRNGIPGKGRLLTAISAWWFGQLSGLCPNHLVTADLDRMPEPVRAHRDQLAGRCMLVRRLRILPVEAIVRGYLAGSGWKEYRERGTVCGISLPPGLGEAAELERPLWTPSTKAAAGAHDQNIHPDEAARILGPHAARVAELAVACYARAREIARARGILIADTKFEFGIDDAGQVVLADEALTPDSSRFWPAASWRPGSNPPSFDKQYLRDWLDRVRFDRNGPGIDLPQDVIDTTYDKYALACRLLTGAGP